MNKWSSLPMWARGVIAVVGVVAVGGIAFGIYRSVKKGVDRIREGRDDREIKDETSQELNQLQNQGIKPTLSDSSAISLANSIESSLAGCELSGTEEQIVKAILSQVNNQADWLKLQNVYGSRTLDNCGWGTGETKQDLKGILTSDLDAFDWTFTLYITKLKEGLMAKGINW